MTKPSPARNHPGAPARVGRGSARQRVRRLPLRQAFPKATEGMPVDEHVEERVEVGNRAPVAQVRTLAAQGNGLTGDALAGGTRIVCRPPPLPSCLSKAAFLRDNGPDRPGRRQQVCQER